MTLSFDLSYEKVPTSRDVPEGSPGTWRVKLPDGTEFLWEGFYTGPATLSHQELQAISHDLLGLDLNDVPKAADCEFRPYVSDGTPVRSIVLHSATPVLKSLQADMNDALNRKPPDDVATYVETRAVALAGPQDLVVGRTHTWRIAAELAGVTLLEMPGIEYYYLSHAILRLAADQGADAPTLARLIEELRTRPDTLVRLYSLDREIQMVLLYLKRMAGIDVLYTDANSPEVAEYWNTKGPLYPTVEEAVKAPTCQDEPAAKLAAERAQSALARRLGVACTVLPGYTLDGRAPAVGIVQERLSVAAGLLRNRYGIQQGCLKPSEGGAGARIVSGIDLSNAGQLRELGERLFAAHEQFVLEAQVEYLTYEVAGREIKLSPSAHVRHGHLTPGMTLQITNGTSWQGNIYIDEATCASVGMSPAHYCAIRANLEELHRGFERVGLGLVTAGFDFAVGRVGGTFGEQVLVALQDPNLSSHGAEYLRLFLDDVAANGGPAYGATKVVIPVAPFQKLRQRAEMAIPGSWVRVMSAIPGRWGMLAVAADRPDAAVELITDWEKKWIAEGLINPAAFR